jgi:hypothetical protein
MLSTGEAPGHPVTAVREEPPLFRGWLPG